MMKLTTRILIAAATVVAAPAVYAQQYPTKPVRIVVPFAPGGGSDFIARFMAQRLSAALGQQVIVENEPGAGGILAIEGGIKPPPVGCTLTLIASSYRVHPSLHQIHFDPLTALPPLQPASER